MRVLRRPLAPRQDLWDRIEAAIDDGGTPARAPRLARRVLPAAGLAAALLLAVAVGWHLHRAGAAAPARAVAAAEPWKPVDPRLAGAAIVLDAAQMELRQAMRQAPDSPALQRLLARTRRQQASLRQLDRRAG